MFRNRRITFILRKASVILGIAALLCATSEFQRTFLSGLSLGPRASLFYLPASVIAIGSLVSPVLAVFGIFLGATAFAILTGTPVASVDVVLAALVPALAAGFAVMTTFTFNGRFRAFYRLQDSYSQIDAIDIFYFCSVYAISNLAITELIAKFMRDDPIEFRASTTFGMMLGDLTGSFLVFIALNLIFSLYMRMRYRSRL